MTERPFEYKIFREQWDTLLEMKKYRQCEKLCHDGLAQSPPDKDRGKLYNHLGFLYENYLEDKTFDDILEHYVLSLQVDESNANSHFNLSNFLLEQGMQHLLRALELNDKHKAATKKLAQLSPLRIGSSILLGDTRYRCVEITEDAIRCVKLRKKYGTDEYEEVDEPPTEIRVGTPHAGPLPGNNNNSKSQSNDSLQNSNNNNSKSNNNSNSHKNGHSTNNSSNNMGAMNVEDGRMNNNYYQLNSNKQSKKCCNAPCILNEWLWLIIWLLAIVGVAAPIVGYFYMNDCEDIEEYTSNSVNINDDNGLNILFVADCNNGTGKDTFLEQLNSIDSMLSTLTSEGVSNVNVGLSQVCNNDTYPSQELTSYDSASSSFFNTTTKTYSISSDIYFTQQLQTCESEYEGLLDASTNENEDQIPALLCVILVTDKPNDYYNSIEYASTSEYFDDIYLAFVTLGDLKNDVSIYTFLGSLSYNRMSVDTTWWSLVFDCDTNSLSSYCQHCLYYSDNSTDIANFECNNVELATLFVTGVMETIFDLASLEYCTMKRYFWYAMGGAGPLLLITLCLVMWLCKQCCCNNNNSGESNSKSNINNENQSLSAHHNHQGLQKETAYV